jgi:hypothetical protein
VAHAVLRQPSMLLSRRHATLGMAALVTSILGGLRTRDASAAGAPIRNLVVFTSGDGSIPEAWGYPAILAPLVPHAADSLLVRGMRFADGARNSNHNGAEVSLRGTGGSLFGGASLDHFVARAKQSTDEGGNAFGLVVPMTNDAPGTTQSRVSYATAGSVASFPHTPLAGFKKLFASSSTPPDEAKTFLDLGVAELQSLQKHLGAEEKARVTGSLEALHKLQQQATKPRAITCAAPAAPSTIDTIQSAQFDDVADAAIELVVMALECNVTNVVTLQFAEDQNFVSAFGSVPGVSSAQPQHQASHENGPTFLAMQTWYTKKLARLVERLKQQGLFADTLVYRTFDFGRGDHQGQKLTFVPALLCSGSRTLARGELDVGAQSRSHDGLMAAVCGAVGVPIAGVAPVAGVLS